MAAGRRGEPWRGLDAGALGRGPNPPEQLQRSLHSGLTEVPYEQLVWSGTPAHDCPPAGSLPGQGPLSVTVVVPLVVVPVVVPLVVVPVVVPLVVVPVVVVLVEPPVPSTDTLPPQAATTTRVSARFAVRYMLRCLSSPVPPGLPPPIDRRALPRRRATGGGEEGERNDPDPDAMKPTGCARVGHAYGRCMMG